MAVSFTHGAGLDVHKQRVTACRITPDATGQQAEGLGELTAFGTLTVDLLARSAGLTAAGITQVAMESTGESWQPVFHLLAGTVQVVLVKAAHVQQGPGRQTDNADARWLAKRMRDGWWQASFIPAPGQRDLGDPTRYRTQWVQERRRAVNRVQGVLARANIKLAAVASDMMGGSGRAIRAVLIEGRTDPATMAERATGRWRRKIPLLEQALTGLVRDPQRRMLAIHLAHIDVVDEQLEALRAEMTRGLTGLRADDAPPLGRHDAGAGGPAADPRPPDTPVTFTRAIALLDTMPGVDQRGAERWVAATGIDMARVGTASRLAVWAGVAPGHDARAGTQRSGWTRPGNQPLRTVLPQLAQAAARTKGTSLSALDHRLAARRGQNRAMVAVAHAMVVRAVPRLSRQEPYQD